MTDRQAQIYAALRESRYALTQAEVAHRVGQDARDARENLHALRLAGSVQYRQGKYSLIERRPA